MSARKILIIAEHLSARQLIVQYVWAEISASVYIYVRNFCVMLRNAIKSQWVFERGKTAVTSCETTAL